MHRTTWYAIPIVGLAVLSSGLGIWSYRLHSDKQALVYQTDAQYSSAFHTLVSDVDELTQRLGESEVSSDEAGFSQCARDIWRLGFAAQTELSKLPVELMPMHNTSAFLSSVVKQSDTWLKDNATTKDPQVKKQVDNDFSQAQKVQSQLKSVQSTVLDKGLGWVAVNRSINQKNGYHTGDNQVVDGLRSLDEHLGTFSEAANLGNQIGTNPAKKSATNQGNAITPTAAQASVAKLLGLSSSQDWKTQMSTLGNQQTVYLISGNTPQGPLTATVSRNGGHILALYVDRQVANDNFGFSQAEAKAETWLQQHGFGDVAPEIANQYQHVGYFVFVPNTKNGWAVDAPISLHMALDNGGILALDTEAYYQNPVPTSAPARKYSASELRSHLNPQLSVVQSRNVVTETQDGQNKSGVEFIGTHADRTYAVVLDATNGQEISVTQIS